MIGQTISHYRILEKIGEGGMGVVYKALDLKLDRFVALKFLPHHLAHGPQDKARFVQEAKAASAIDHPNICTIHEIDETSDGRLFIVMGCYEGGELDKKTRTSPLELEDALDIAIQVAEGLGAAHQKGIIHRDIKSSNILVNEIVPSSSWRVKIIDFGLAKYPASAGRSENDSMSGTVFSMSPEQVRGEKIDQRTDIWSLGVVLYEMVSGRLPFLSEYQEAVFYLILNTDPPSITSFRTEIPPEVERIVAKCLEKEPEDRYQNMEEVLTDLRNEKISLYYSKNEYHRMVG